MQKILVIGSNGQIGTELVKALRRLNGEGNVIAADLNSSPEAGPFVQLDILNKRLLERVVRDHKITHVYALAAMLSAAGEKLPGKAWQLNMQGLLNVLDLAIKYRFRVFWPSSIAVFGPDAPKVMCPQDTVIQPSTVYGISKIAGELWCRYYFEKHHVDVRSLRYPGLISYTTAPGGGTTDYAVDIFHMALNTGQYTCFLKENTCLPMMYMPDAVRATIRLMDAPSGKISVRTSYNISAMHFTPGQIAAAIGKYVRDFRITYAPDFRQSIAESWPQSMDDSAARNDWAWRPEYDMKKMVVDMLHNLRIGNKFHLAGSTKRFKKSLNNDY